MKDTQPRQTAEHRGQWREQWTMERVTCEIAAFLARHEIVGRFPTEAEWLTLDPTPRYDLLNQFYRRGGRKTFGPLLGLSDVPVTIPNPYMQPGALIPAIRAFAEEQHLTRMPTLRELRAAGRSDLHHAVTHSGGVRHIAEQAGLPWVHQQQRNGTPTRRPRPRLTHLEMWMVPPADFQYGGGRSRWSPDPRMNAEACPCMRVR